VPPFHRVVAPRRRNLQAHERPVLHADNCISICMCMGRVMRQALRLTGSWLHPDFVCNRLAGLAIP
jgi:hypothetical protein